MFNKKILNQAKFDHKTKGLNNRVCAVRERIYTELVGSSLSFYGAEVPKDLIYEICAHCVLGGGMKSIKSLARTNKHLYRLLVKEKNLMELSPAFLARIALTELCPKLTILDLDMMGFEVDDAPPFPNKDWVVRAYQKIACRVEGNAGVTLQCMPKGLDILQMEDGEKYGVALQKGPGACNGYGDPVGYLSVAGTYWVVVANNVAKRSGGIALNEQVKLISTMGCSSATFQELVLLCVGTKKCFDKYLFPHPMYARTTLVLGGSPLSIGQFNLKAKSYYYLRLFESNESACGMVPSLQCSPHGS